MDKSKAVLDALESEDPVIIKTIRGSQLGNLSRSLNALKTALVVKKCLNKSIMSRTLLT